MNKKRHQAGFTLIEALAVIAIIGLLSAFAIPSYLDYLAKTRVSEMFVLARTAQLGIADAIYSGTIMAEIDNEAAGHSWVDNQHERIESIIVDAGRIVMKGKSDKMSIPKAKPGDVITVYLSPKESNGIINWQCDYSNADHKKFLPKHCVLDHVDGV